MADYSTLGIRLARSNILIGAVQGGFAPTPRGRRSTGFPIGTGRAEAVGEVGTTVSREQGRDGEDAPLGRAPSAPSAPSSLTGYAAQLRDAVVGQIESQFAFPTALNPLTGTVRATSVSPVLGAMMPSPMQAMMSIGYKANMANLTDIAQQTSIGTPGYGIGMLNNQMVGTSPSGILGALGISGTSTMSGMIGSPPGIVSMSDYTDAIKSALLSSTVTTYGPARAVAMGLSPQATYGLPDITSAVATSLYGWDTSVGTGSVLGGFQDAFSGVVTSIDQRTGLPTPVRSFDYETKTWSGTVKSPTSDIGLIARPGEFGYSAGQSAGELGGSKSGAGIGPGMGSTTGLGMETGRDPGTNRGTSSSSSSSPSSSSSSSSVGRSGPGDMGGGDGSDSGSSCFAAGTKFFMEDGSLKNIEDIKIGDVLQEGGKVRTIIVGDGLYETWFLYGSTKVTGTHTVFENGMWKRVQNSDNATPTDKDEFVYTLINEKHRLVAEDGVMFGDYDEVDNLDIEDDLLAMMNEMHNA